MVDAAADGLLDETAWVDLKRELPAAGGRTHHNTEIAKDLAAMAVDGGMLVIGVADDHSRAGKVTGVGLAGLADRITSIAGGKVRPPVSVRCVEIPDPDRPGLGCLLVLIPPSPLAPHMVDSVYWGRTDKGNERLTDDKVRRIMAARAAQAGDIVAELHAFAGRDPFPADRRHNGHLYLIARPAAGTQEALVPFLTRPGMRQELQKLLGRIAVDVRGHHLPQADTERRRADGLVLSPHPGRSDFHESGLNDLTLHEDGTLTLTNGSLVELRTPHGGSGDSQHKLVWTPAMLGAIHAVLLLAGRLGDEQIGYQGPWQIGLRIEGLDGAAPIEATQGMDLYLRDVYDRDVYEKTTTAVTAELVTGAHAVVERLVAPLLRGLLVGNQYLPYTEQTLQNVSRR